MASIARRKNGWQVQIRRRGCKPLSKNFKSVADARAWARSIEAEVDRGLFVDWTAAKQTTVADLLARYERKIMPRKRGVKEERSRL